MSTRRSPRTLRWTTSALLFVALTCLAVTMTARAEEPVKPDPVALLRTCGELYSRLDALQVKTRSEIPLPEGAARVHLLPRFEGASPVGIQPSGTFVRECEWRIRRDRVLRMRVAHLGQKGSSLTRTAGWGALRDYDLNQDKAVPLPPIRAITRVRSADNRWSFDDYSHKPGSPTLELPFKLFLASHPEAILAAERVEYLRAAADSGHDCHVLRLDVNHSIIRSQSAQYTEKNWSFDSATWTLWIDRASSLIQRAEVHEEWHSRRPDKAGHLTAARLDVRETYSNQRLDPPFTDDDFLPEPPDPVQPAKVKSP